MRSCLDLQITLAHCPIEDKNYLTFEEEGLTLVFNEMRVCFDFISLLKRHLKQHYAITKEPLAKSLGIKGGKERTILDATCGTGADSMLMLAFGASVFAYERDQIVYALLLDALRRAFLVEFFLPFKDKFNLFLGDARNATSSITSSCQTIYIDPMYEIEKRKARQKKEMFALDGLLGKAGDGEELFHWALRVAKERVVVKRPIKAKKILDQVTASYLGKSTRYDMYISHNLEN